MLEVKVSFKSSILLRVVGPCRTGQRSEVMKIGELARSAGLNASAIRYYEKVGLISPPYRSSGQRRYAQDSLDRVLLKSALPVTWALL